jgi:hypothetical protein
MDSIVSKNSRDIKFAKFGPLDYFIWILQGQDRNKYLNFKFKLGFDRGRVDWSMWQPLIGLYRFGMG